MKIKIRTKLIVIFIFLYTIPIMISSIIYIINVKDFAGKNSVSLNIQNMSYIGASVDLVFNYIYNYSLYPPFDNNIVSYLTADSDSDSFYSLSRTATDSIILLPYTTNSHIQGVSIWRNDGLHIQSGRTLSLSEDEMEFLQQTKGNPVWTFQKGTSSSIIYFSRLLKNPLNLQSNLGYIKIQLDNQSLNTIFSNPSNNSSIYFIKDTEGTILYQSCPIEEIAEEFPTVTEAYLESLDYDFLKSHQGTSIFQEEFSCYVTPHVISNTDWLLFSISANSFSMDLSGYTKRVFSLCIMICMPACILLAIVFSSVILSPLKKMGQLMQQIEQENFSVHLNVNSNDELAVLARQFNHMSDELSDLYTRVYLGNIRLKEAQLSALQAQINPHFLYNTLDTIYWMSEFHNTTDVSKMVSALSQLFRLSLSGDQNERIPLSSELEHVKCFLYIQKIRYDDQLDYSIDILDDYLKEHASECMVLKLILQPITENAIIHGIDRSGSGTVRITIFMKNDCLFYEISNTGTADVEHIRQILSDPAYPSGSIGLCNIQQRIHLKYGTDYGIICFNREDCTVFQVKLPIQPF